MLNAESWKLEAGSWKLRAAAQQAAQGCDKPVLIRVQNGGSHNFRSTDKRIAELVDRWTFKAAAMGIQPPGRLTG